ncbi:hypothetical protein ABIF63_001521 [Bradyrhizobium japonicum]|uniref:Uncharacterized protein n=1 Tax=Bradyrhizobium japonicum TaxID=375 RepID=A0ABV2RM87_BRAJP|nr:hypothetical protein [Bradyrhizobium japonicum]UQD99036.1 hypothetical protein JEY30_01715 [Bradyrhizobium japonicum]WLB19031.1 hypothetical protein QIH95_45160 [Bradyrhizobium japonicum]
MSLDKPRKLIDVLLRRTKKGEIDWQESLGNDTYQVSFKDNSLQLSVGPTKLQGADGLAYTVSVLNSEGDVADRFTDEDLDKDEFGSIGREWYDRLQELHGLARRWARGADKVLDEILREVDDDDDIPF